MWKGEEGEKRDLQLVEINCMVLSMQLFERKREKEIHFVLAVE